MSQKVFQSEFDKGQLSQQENNQLLDELSVQQALMTQQLNFVSDQLLSKELTDAIAQKVADRLSLQGFYPALLPTGYPTAPQPSLPAQPAIP